MMKKSGQCLSTPYRITAASALNLPPGPPPYSLFSVFRDGRARRRLATGRRSAKVANLAERPRASFFVEPAGQEPPKWRSALFTGEVREVTCATKRDAALAAVSARNAYIRERLAQNGGADFAIYRLETREIEWLDRTKGAGYVERILVAEEVPA